MSKDIGPITPIPLDPETRETLSDLYYFLGHGCQTHRQWHTMVAAVIGIDVGSLVKMAEGLPLYSEVEVERAKRFVTSGAFLQFGYPFVSERRAAHKY